MFGKLLGTVAISIGGLLGLAAPAVADESPPPDPTPVNSVSVPGIGTFSYSPAQTVNGYRVVNNQFEGAGALGGWQYGGVGQVASDEAYYHDWVRMPGFNLDIKSKYPTGQVATFNVQSSLGNFVCDPMCHTVP